MSTGGNLWGINKELLLIVGFLIANCVHVKMAKHMKINSEEEILVLPFHYDCHIEDMSSLSGKRHISVSSRPFSANMSDQAFSAYGEMTPSVLPAAKLHCTICISFEEL